MKIARHYTLSHASRIPNSHISESIAWKTTSVLIKDGSGKILCDYPELEVPESWSQSASDILAHKYLRKAGVHSREDYKSNATNPDFPQWLAPSVCMVKGTGGSETSAKQVFHRIVGHWTYSGFVDGYFDTEEDAQAYYDEMYWMLAHQIAAPNSPQWFNTGLWWAYGIEGISENAWRCPAERLDAEQVVSNYQYPQTSACFILDIKDKLLGESGILDTIKREAHIFKYGSGCGINYSTLRAAGSPLSNGGVSSGLMSFLKVFDANAGAIKSGGTTRRAARMVVVDCDHPEAEAFVEWKAREEVKVAAMALGARTAEAPTRIMQEVCAAIQTPSYEGEGYNTVSGQNANNSLRVTNTFMKSVEAQLDSTKSRDARLWDKAIDAAWACGDPGIQFHDTCNDWHTIPKVSPQRATNPCSEFSFIDNSSCNLASMNLVKFLDGKNFDAASFEHVVRLWITTLDLTISMSSYPTKEVAENSMYYRPLGLGYANLGGLLMLMGVPYDSDEGRRIAGTITSAMQAFAWSESASLAAHIGEFKDFNKHAADVKHVLDKHRTAHSKLLTTGENDPVFSLLEATTVEWESWGSNGGFSKVRNAQLTLLAPTGTIGLVMDVATTGVEPDFSLIKHKKLAGGGSMTLVNPYVYESLTRLGYSSDDANTTENYIKEHGRVDKLCSAIRMEHISVFDCANDISWGGHIAMMIAVQPFLSGAISKTVNMPNYSTREDVSRAYKMAWEGGLKALAIYRDGCKLSQPLTAVKKPVVIANDVAMDIGRAVEVATDTATKVVKRGELQTRSRYKLKSRRRGFTQKVRIGGHNVYLRTGEYEDGSLGEIFLTISREGSTLKHLLDAFAVATSIGLQYGVPLQEYVDAFVDSKSEPAGLVQGSEQVRMCSSILDFVVRQLDADYGKREFLPKTEIVEAPIETGESPKPALTVVQDVEVRHVINEAVDDDDDVEDIMSEPMEMPKLVAAGMRTLSSAAVNPVPLFKSATAPPSAVRYTGEACPSCQSFTLRRNGSCFLCDSCGSTTGCS